LPKSVTEVRLVWVEGTRYYLLESPDGEIAIQEIPETRDPWKLLSCMGVIMKFIGRSKEKPQRYTITIEHHGDA
jgi:hypothetical protein